jgi:hypothetical protein
MIRNVVQQYRSVKLHAGIGSEVFAAVCTISREQLQLSAAVV